jgi:hypothetical protein
VLALGCAEADFRLYAGKPGPFELSFGLYATDHDGLRVLSVTVRGIAVHRNSRDQGQNSDSENNSKK